MFDRERKRHEEGLRVLLAGPYPEPVGGVSVHMARLSLWLIGHGIEVDVVDESRCRKDGIYNLRSLKILSYLRRLAKCNLVHIHSCVHLFRILHIAMCRLLGLRVIVTIHGWPAEGAVKSVLTVSANRVFLSLAHQVILVSEETNRRLRLRNYRVLPAFLPPIGPRQDLPREMTDFLVKARVQGQYLLCANAYEMTEIQGEDLYGLDLCIELIDRLAHRSEVKAAMVFVVSCNTAGNRRYMAAEKRIAERGLESYFYLYGQPVDFVTLLKQCDLVLRPTNTDGDALTIREALHFGVPVIASDAVQRPPGSILFRSRDVEDLLRQVVRVLKDDTHPARPPVQTNDDAYFKRYLDLYLEVLKSDGHATRLRETTTA